MITELFTGAWHSPGHVISGYRHTTHGGHVVDSSL